MSVIEISGVHRWYRGSPPVHALRGVSFTVEAGEIVGLLGANGAGKTTLIKILSTLLLPTSGTVRICGADVVGRARNARRHLSVVFGGDRGLYGRLTARDNLVFFASLHGQSQALRSRADLALAEVGLAEHAGRAVETFSRGMRQRLHLASGLMLRTEVLLLDEPTIGLDVAEAMRLRATVRRIADSGTAIILTSHYPADIDALADRIVLLADGVVTHDSRAAMFRQAAGFAADIKIYGLGPPPVPASGVAECTQGDDGTWCARLRVHEWDRTALTALADLVGSTMITGIEIQPAGVETVLLSLLHQTGQR